MTNRADYSDVIIVGAFVIAVFAYFYRKRATERKLKEQAEASCVEKDAFYTCC